MKINKLIILSVMSLVSVSCINDLNAETGFVKDTDTEVSPTENYYDCGNEIVEPGEECDDNYGKCIQCHKPREIFVTSILFTGSEIGLLASDICSELRESNGFKSEFILKPWISYSYESVNESIYHSPGLYKNVNQIIAYNWEDLIDGSLNNTIDFDENEISSADVGYYDIWTGTDFDGNIEANCNDWKSNGRSDQGVFGSNQYLDNRWTFEQGDSCSSSKHIYCIESEYLYK